jgi:hypothetical protein
MRVRSSEYPLHWRLRDWLISWDYSRPVSYDCVLKSRFPEVESILAEERERFGI